ncbi:MAG: adenosylcobalamin-dependent ribonucleoside-diphosphate reductase [Phycisphaeraceae bacterium]|nr:adenosylcobalamin-dependent ribonucleoside-diphosphate reductase [Phycisphaeraceae bacterium]
MKISRKFTTAGTDPFASVKWAQRSSKITNPDGSVVFEMKDAHAPEGWSQLAVDIMVSKYFRKAGVPQFEDPYGLPGASPAKVKDGKPVTGPERSAKQVIHRLAGCWRHWGEKHGYFDTKEDAQAFYDELVYMMVHQMCAPNSPQWFNTGLNYAYGITGPSQGHWIVNAKTGKPGLAADAYTHPQPHACFIQSVSDDLVNEGGIMDLWVREARLFKYGSGTGTNFSTLRAEGEKLSGGGRSSGLMSWLKIGDRAASAIKSGGTTRRAAKMVCLDMDHPDIENFVTWKVREEIKVQAMVEGLKLLKKHDSALTQQCKDLNLELDYDFNGEAYQTVSGQNSNNSVRIPDEFFDAVDADGDWVTRHRVSGEPARTFNARELWAKIGSAAWRCADPGVQYDTTINAWHTCPNAGRINASNPCSEYMFLDNTACNLASLNVMKFYDAERRTFDVERFEHGIDLWTIVLEISVLMAAFPSREIAELSYKYRTLGLGYANLGAMLMQAGVAYDSDEARAVCAGLTSILTGRSYRASAQMAKEHGPFPGYAADRENMLRVIRNHRRAAHGVGRDSNEYENLRIRPVPIDHALLSSGKVRIANAGALLSHAVKAWDEALALGEKHGYRNAQVTVIAPTGTIGLLMDCDTTGVEPDFALVKFKKLAGGGYFKIANESVRPGLKALGYSDRQITEIMTYILGALTLNVNIPGGKGTLSEWLAAKGMSPESMDAIEATLPGTFDLGFAFAAWAIPAETLKACGVDPGAATADPSFNLLKHLGLSARQIEALNLAICGTGTIEGAPHLRAEDLPVFDCASTCGKLGKRFIAPEGHIKMMAAAQPFISGAISKTINLPNHATEEDVVRCYRLSWELGLKANALYRDGCKLSQPLSATTDEAKKEARQESGTAEEPADHPTPAQTAPSTNGNGALAAVAAVTDGQGVHPSPPRAHRRRLPDTRRSVTHRFNVAGHEGYLTVGLYDDGQPGELFITMSKEGSTIGGLMDSLGTATSVALQYGVPVKSLVDKFSHQRFEPAGITENRDIPLAKSLVDYIFRWMGMQFVEGYREANAPRRGGDLAPAPAPAPPLAAAPERRTVVDTAPASRFSGASQTGDDPTVSTHFHQSVVQVESKDGVAKSMTATLDVYMESVGDAPACDVCGTITVRSGTCYKCVNCGNSMGCS